jgi:citrate lyase beta subunit
MNEATHWSDLEIWELEDAVLAPHAGDARIRALQTWRRGLARGACFVRIRGSNRTIRAEQVDWSEFPIEGQS